MNPFTEPEHIDRSRAIRPRKPLIGAREGGAEPV
jgi:hypothetical protein